MLARAHAFPLSKEENGAPSPQAVTGDLLHCVYLSQHKRAEQQREARAAELWLRAAGTHRQVPTRRPDS